jgi:hypothetical protein
MALENNHVVSLNLVGSYARISIGDLKAFAHLAEMLQVPDDYSVLQTDSQKCDCGYSDCENEYNFAEKLAFSKAASLVSA